MSLAEESFKRALQLEPARRRHDAQLRLLPCQQQRYPESNAPFSPGAGGSRSYRRRCARTQLLTQGVCPAHAGRAGRGGNGAGESLRASTRPARSPPPTWPRCSYRARRLRAGALLHPARQCPADRSRTHRPLWLAARHRATSSATRQHHCHFGRSTAQPLSRIAGGGGLRTRAHSMSDERAPRRRRARRPRASAAARRARSSASHYRRARRRRDQASRRRSFEPLESDRFVTRCPTRPSPARWRRPSAGH